MVSMPTINKDHKNTKRFDTRGQSRSVAQKSLKPIKVYHEFSLLSQL